MQIDLITFVTKLSDRICSASLQETLISSGPFAAKLRSCFFSSWPSLCREFLRRSAVASQDFCVASRWNFCVATLLRRRISRRKFVCAAVKFVLRRNLLRLNILECNFRVATMFFRRARLRRNCSRRKTFAPQANAILASQLFATQFLFECNFCVATFFATQYFFPQQKNAYRGKGCYL